MKDYVIGVPYTSTTTCVHSLLCWGRSDGVFVCVGVGACGSRHCTIETHTSSKSVADPEETPFLVLACDGVWDVLSDDEAVALVLEEWEKEVGGLGCVVVRDRRQFCGIIPVQSIHSRINQWHGGIPGPAR